MRRIAFSVCAVVVLAISSPTAALNGAPPVVPDFLDAHSIIPPGQSGIDPAHLSDQLSMYTDLIDYDSIIDADLDVLFHDFQFGPASIEHEYSPRSDVTVYRDGLGIPHVYGDTDDAAAFGLGYVTAEDRLWHMDVLRHAALGRISEILGEDAFSFDKDVRRDTYSLSELRAMSDYVADRYGSTGEELVALLDAYATGVNAYLSEVRMGTKPKPIEYTLRHVKLENWRPTDTIALAVFQLRQFGEAAGAELRNAALYQNLRKRLGTALGTGVFRDLTDVNDSNAYATVPESEGAFPSQDLGARKRRAVAIPDQAERAWNRVASPARSALARAFVPSSPASHFLAVAPAESEAGISLQWGGPQVGYSVPQFFMEVDVHSPSMDFRGPALPGASVLVPLGRGIDYAWSLTSGVSDAVDTRIEKVCAPHRYRFNGRCRRMQQRTEVIRFGSGPNAKERRIKVFRTVHGPVIGRGRVNGDPVAFVRQRRFWKHEIDTLPAIYEMVSNSMDTLDEFKSQLSKWTVSFNVSYVDAENIAYFHAGKYPERALGVDPMLPTWGTGRWEWTGTIPFSNHPQMVNPAQGWLANWNNKPSAGWDNGDGTQWGPTQRVRMLSDKMQALVAGAEQASLAEIVDVIRESATQDARAVYIGNDMLDFVAGSTGTEAEARDAVGAWIAAGAHRLDQNGDQLQDAGPAVAVFDRWYELLVRRIFDDELGNDYNLTPVPISDDASRSNGSSYFADFSNYLWNVFNGSGDYVRDYCDDIGTEGIAETCAQQAQAALSVAVVEISTDQGPTVANWTHPADYIEFDAVGGLVMPPIPWQNRGTYNQAVEVTGSRP